LWYDYVPNYHTLPNIIDALDQEHNNDENNQTTQGNDNGDNNQTTSDGSENDGDTTSTPGFEIFLVIIAFIIIIATKRKKEFL